MIYACMRAWSRVSSSWAQVLPLPNLRRGHGLTRMELAPWPSSVSLHFCVLFLTLLSGRKRARTATEYEAETEHRGFSAVCLPFMPANLGIDLANTSCESNLEELDRILFDAMLEGLDTGVPCLHPYMFPPRVRDFYTCEADAARHVVTMGQLFGNMRTPAGGEGICVLLLFGVEALVISFPGWGAGPRARIGAAICIDSSTALA